MHRTYKQGFTLLEIIIAIAVVAVMAIVIVPNLAPKKASQERETFISRLNTLSQFAWQNALAQNMLHRVVFDFKEKNVFVEKATEKKDPQGEPTFAPVDITYVDTRMSWPEHLSIKQFKIEGYDEMKRFVGRDTGKTWFYVVPDGFTQAVTINMVDTADRDQNGRPKKVGLVLNPFTAQFKVYDSFKT